MGLRLGFVGNGKILEFSERNDKSELCLWCKIKDEFEEERLKNDLRR